MFKQKTVIPMGIDPAPLWENLLLYFFESKCFQQLISIGSPRAYTFNGTSTFIDDFCIVNDDGDFSYSYKYIYPRKLAQKVEHQREQATFLGFDVKIEDNMFA